MMRILAMSFLALCGLILPLAALAQTPAGPSAAQTETARRFRAYLDEDWKQWMADYPEFATAVGFPGENRRWTDLSPEGNARRKQHLHDSLAKLENFQREDLPPAERINYDLYRELLETAEEGLQYGDDPMPFRNVVPANLWMPINQMGGVQQDGATVLAIMPHQSVADYEDIIARLEALPKLVEQVEDLLKEGLKKGYTPPRITLRDVPKQITDLVPDDPHASPLLEPFENFPASIPIWRQSLLRDHAFKIYVGVVAPPFQNLRDYLGKTYLPACRESIAATALPNGAAAYAYHVRWQTTTNLTPQQIHEIGLAEVKRIRAEMDKVIAASGFQGDFHAFTEFLRHDPRFYYDNATDLVNGYRVIAKKADPQLAHLFGKLPRLPYGVTPIPDFKAPSQTTGYYENGSAAAGRPGEFFVNTYNLQARPKWEMEALSLHESVPGHHLQFSLAEEMEDVPEFRKQVGYSAYVEGWALYCESLGGEMGFYADPYSKFGQLSFEMWRAVRLVVDTGMHSKGWTREQAINFFTENTGKTAQDITVEVDRYIVWPGQALAYKLGQLKIRGLRNEAEAKLGAKFDIRKFHDAVLAEGALPLGVLELRMKMWIDAQEK